MGLTHAKVAVSHTSATLLAGGGRAGVSAALKNTGSTVVSVGDATVLANDGWPLAPGETIGVDLERGNDAIYGICGGTDTGEIRVLVVDE